MFDLKLSTLQEKSLHVVEKAQSFWVVDEESYKEASDFAVACQTAIKSIETQRKALKEPFLQSCKDIDNAAKELSAPFEKAKSTVQDMCVAFMKEQERKRIEAERKAREEAEAERKRLEAEAQALKEKADDTENFDEAIEAQIQASEIEEKAAQVSPVVQVVEVPKSSAAMQIKRKVSCTVVDTKAFLQYIVRNCDSNPALLNFVKPEVTKINKFVDAMGGQIKIDGVEVAFVEKAVTRSRRLSNDVIDI